MTRAIVAVLTCVLLAGCAATGPNPDGVPGMATFKAGRSVIKLRDGVSAIYFTPQDQRNLAPEFKKIAAGLYIDSALVGHTVFPVTRAEQLRGIEFPSEPIRALLVRIDARSVTKDSRSPLHTLRFSEAVPVDSVVKALREIPGVWSAGAVGRVYLSGRRVLPRAAARTKG